MTRKTDQSIQFKPNMSVQNLHENGAGITTLINIGYD